MNTRIWRRTWLKRGQFLGHVWERGGKINNEDNWIKQNWSHKGNFQGRQMTTKSSNKLFQFMIRITHAACSSVVNNILLCGTTLSWWVNLVQVRSASPGISFKQSNLQIPRQYSSLRLTWWNQRITTLEWVLCVCTIA